MAPTDGARRHKCSSMNRGRQARHDGHPTARRWRSYRRMRRAIRRGEGTRSATRATLAVATNGGAPRRVTNVMNGVSNCTISPNGGTAACISRTGPSDKWPAGKERSDVRHYANMSYKFNDSGWYDDRRSHLWVVDISSGTPSRSPSATSGTTPTRSGRRTARGSRSSRTGPAGVRRRPQQGRLDDSGDRLRLRRSAGRRIAYESIIGGGAGQSAALVARRELDRLRDGRRRRSAATTRDRPGQGRRREAPIPSLDLIPTDLQWARMARCISIPG